MDSNQALTALIATIFVLSGAHSIELQVFNGFANSGCFTAAFGVIQRYDFDLRAFGNLAVSVNGVGNWIFYESEGYRGESEVHALRSFDECVRLETLAGRVSSVRYAGDGSDYRKPSITLYKGTNFTGPEIYVTDEHHKALLGAESSPYAGWSEPFGSFIVTGGEDSCWTLYSMVRFEREARCVCGHASPDFQPTLVAENPFPPSHLVGSVRKGCWAGADEERGQAMEGHAGELVVKDYQTGLTITN